MAKLHFFYGAMGSFKSGHLGVNAYNIKQKGEKYLEVLKPSIDDRDSSTEIVSRVGIRTPANVLKNLLGYTPKKATKFILVDEVQFFSIEDINILAKIAFTTDIHVFCYGLKIDYNGNIFPAAAALWGWGAKLHELETPCNCKDCFNNATHHLLYSANNRLVRGGYPFQIGDTKKTTGTPRFKSVCQVHFMEKYYGIKEITSKKR